MDKATKRAVPYTGMRSGQTVKTSARLIRYQAMLALLQGRETSNNNDDLYTAAARLMAFRYGLGKNSIFL